MMNGLSFCHTAPMIQMTIRRCNERLICKCVGIVIALNLSALYIEWQVDLFNNFWWSITANFIQHWSKKSCLCRNGNVDDLHSMLLSSTDRCTHGNENNHISSANSYVPLVEVIRSSADGATVKKGNQNIVVTLDCSESDVYTYLQLALCCQIMRAM